MAGERDETLYLTDIRDAIETWWSATCPLCASRSERPRLMRKHRASGTARLAALFRSVLTMRSGRGCVNDPYAHLFLSGPLRALGALLTPGVIRALDRGLAGLFTVVAARTCFFDDALRRAIETGRRQVVLLGAGYDSRALRFRAPGVRFFEVDHPATQAEKRARLRAAGLDPGAVFVPVDFAADDVAARLIAAGHDPGQPTFFLWEGGTMYLAEGEVRRTLRAVASLAADGSELAFDVAARSLEGFSAAQRRLVRLGGALLAMGGEPIRFRSAPASLAPVLAEEGWRIREAPGTDQLFARYLEGTFLCDPGQPLDYVALAARSLRRPSSPP